MSTQIPPRSASKYSGQYAAAFDPQRIIEIFNDSHRLALSSKNPSTATDRYSLALEAYHQVMSMDCPAAVRLSIQQAMEELVDLFPAQVVANEARGLREKAAKLKTPRKKGELLSQAKAILDRGLAQDTGSPVLLAEASEVADALGRLEPT